MKRTRERERKVKESDTVSGLRRIGHKRKIKER
jgi:hypothetical protein